MGKEQEGETRRGRGRKKKGADIVDASRACIRQIRKKMWFEKFYWFVSSSGKLVLGGRDARQNELLVKRYLRASDLYVHADVHGASSIIIRSLALPARGIGVHAEPGAHGAASWRVACGVWRVACDLTTQGRRDRSDGQGAVDDLTLQEAGQFAVLRSSSWHAKLAGATAAYWVYAHQVSKVAEAGEYLSLGALMVRGKKNFISIHRLEVGIGFHLSRFIHGICLVFCCFVILPEADGNAPACTQLQV